jgi:hypothetical protein
MWTDFFLRLAVSLWRRKKNTQKLVSIFLSEISQYMSVCEEVHFVCKILIIHRQIDFEIYFCSFHILKGLYTNVWAFGEAFHSSSSWAGEECIRVKKKNMPGCISLAHCTRKSVTSIRNSISFQFSEFSIVSHCLILVVAPTVEISSPTLLFCKTFHCKCDSFPVGWRAVHSCAEGCHCSVITKLQKNFPLHVYK